MNRKPDYLDRLGRSESLGSWAAEELTAALELVRRLDVKRRHPARDSQVIDIRLTIYQRRLQYELDHRSGHHRGFDEP